MFRLGKYPPISGKTPPPYVRKRLHPFGTMNTRMPRQPCSHPECRALAKKGRSRCDLHPHVQPKRKPKSKQVQAFYNSTKWRKLRRRLVGAAGEECPRCGTPEILLKSIGHSLHVHHSPKLVTLLARGENPYDTRYLTVLCTTCHAEIEAQQAIDARPDKRP